MTAQANGGTYSDPFIRSLRTSGRDAAHHTSDPAPRLGSRLNNAAAIPPVQVGGLQRQRLSIEAGHHTLMEQLQKILAEVDQGKPGEFEALRRENKSTRQQFLGLRAELDTVTAMPRGDVSGAQLLEHRLNQIAQERLKEVKQELRTAQDSLLKTATKQHEVIEQRLGAIEPKIAVAEQNWRQIDEWHQDVEQRFGDTDEHLLATVQRLHALEQQITNTVSETLGLRLQSAEHRLLEISQELRATQNEITVSTERHKALEQSLRTTEPKIALAEQSWRRIDEWRQNVDQRFNDADEQLQAAVQRLHGLEHQLTEAVGQISILEPKIKSCEDHLQCDTGRLTIETRKILEQQTNRLENVEISIGALAQQIEHVKAPLSKARDARLEDLQDLLTSTRRMQWFAMVAWFMSLLLVGYGGLGSPGFSVVRQYLSHWLPNLLT